jgi:hypothetical protein
MSTCGAPGCEDPAVGMFCAAHAASKSDAERARDGDERKQR